MDVYVLDNRCKWNREKANEDFLSFDVNDGAIKLWDNMLFVGMSKESLLERVKNEECHEGFGVITVYSKIFETNFYFEDDKINNIKINRIRLDYSKQQLLEMNHLDSIYLFHRLFCKE